MSITKDVEMKNGDIIEVDSYIADIVQYLINKDAPSIYSCSGLIEDHIDDIEMGRLLCTPYLSFLYSDELWSKFKLFEEEFAKLDITVESTLHLRTPKSSDLCDHIVIYIDDEHDENDSLIKHNWDELGNLLKLIFP